MASEDQQDERPPSADGNSGGQEVSIPDQPRDEDLPAFIRNGHPPVIRFKSGISH